MLSKTAEYALRIVTLMSSEPSQIVIASSMADRTKVPKRYIRHVLQALIAAGLVRSRPGPGGGYELTKETGAITILDVVNAVSPVERIRSCPLGLTSHASLCPLHTELDRVYAASEAALASVTLKQLVESTSPILPLCDI